VAAQVAAALGEDQPRALGPAEQRHEDGGAAAAVRVQALGRLGLEEASAQVGAQLAQMITWTVPPSTPQAAPRT
jgi:uncharacterized membrane protein